VPHIYDRILFLLSCLGLPAALLAGFLTYAPNRLASGIALPLSQAPALESTAAIGGLCALLLLSFVQQQEFRSAAAIIAAALILWGIMAGAGHLAARLVTSGPPAARVSLGPGFWTLAGVAILATAGAAQRGNYGLLARSFTGAAFCAGFCLMAARGDFDKLALAREFLDNRAALQNALSRHLALVGAASCFALIIGVPLTMAALRKRAAAGVIFASLSLVQTIPSIALFGVLIAPLSKLSEQLPLLRDLGISGTGPAPAIIALTLYSLLPLVRSFHAGLMAVDADVKEAAAAIGFSPRQVLIRVELPLALPALLSGLRMVTIQAIGLASVAALIGAGGLGTFIFQGIGQYALDLVLAGALPIILLALLANFIFEMALGLARRNW
jgi:osmoprotectant transport system permease protein